MPPASIASPPGAAASFWRDLDVDERDRLAWQVICDWPRLSGVDTRRDGLDFAHLTRAFLWDKVGRAVRREIDPEAFEAERRPLAAVETPPVDEEPHGRATLKQRLDYKRGEWSLRRRRTARARELERRRREGARTLFCPFPYSRHARVLGPLIEHGEALLVVVPEAHWEAWPDAYPARTGASGVPPSAAAFAETLFGGIRDGLRSLHVELETVDEEALRGELRAQQATVAAAGETLRRLRPDAVWVPADNHSPFIETVMVARREGIPVAMQQHGLDCERYYLDEAYATHLGLWGNARRERYARESTFQPARMELVGNPHYDFVDAAGSTGAPGADWLWVTRPHTSRKCYAPSRRPDEGEAILAALLDALVQTPGARLRIKPHPFDDVERYRLRLARHPAGPRAAIVEDRLFTLLENAGVVVSEDSTAGMDAMLAGRPLVHAHFAPVDPVMPFVSYGAALPGFTPDALAGALRKASAMDRAERDSLAAAQRAFLDDFAGPRDGGATARFVEFVQDTVFEEGN